MNVKAWMIDTVQITAKTGQSTHGDPTYGAAVPVKCRQGNSQKVIKDIDGNERQSNHQVVTDIEVASTSLLYLVGETPGTDSGHEIIRIDSAATKAGSMRLWHLYL